MRIAIDIRRAGDFGIGTYLRNIINQLARQDRTNEYLLIGRPEHLAEFDPLPANFQWLDYRHAPASLHTHFHLPIVLQEQRVDLLHMPWFYAPAWVPCPMVLTVHDLTDVLAPADNQPLLQSGRLFFARRALAKARRIMTVSQAGRRELARVFGIAETKIEVIYNALDERLVREPFPAEADRILERHAVHFPFLLYAGNIKPHKNLVRLIEAFAVVKAELGNHPELRQLKLLVIGDELAKHPDLRRAVVRSRVREDVRFMGFVPYQTLRVFYARARAFVFPSLYEGFGLPPLEAMAHGTPVVTSNLSSLPEVVGDAAVLVNPENVFDIVRGIRLVLTDACLREELVRRGYQQVQRYSWERSVAQIRAVYQAALEHPAEQRSAAAVS
ncbi:MAG: glycosyltransferase family 4 protein [Firmicutes bacterium]|nr:glycosyltransferase family 4 protein [Bacillota bacterium]